MFTIKKSIYNSLPIGIKRLASKVPYAFLIGGNYRNVSAVCTKLEYASHAEIRIYQKQVLFKILDFATREVEAYKKHRGVVERLSPFESIKDFPLLSKEILQSNIEKYIPDGIRKIAHHQAFTGGSSGNQLQFNEDDISFSREMAFIHQQWKRIGYKPGLKKATFRGVSFNLSPDTYWQENPIHNELQFSPFHMNDTTLNLYLKKLISYQPSFLHGYPSAIDTIAEYVLRQNLQGKLPLIKAALLGSESCSENQRKRIERAFNTEVFSWYGHSERVILAGECEKNDTYHHFPSYGFLELLSGGDKPCSVGERGELIGTTFWNLSMPLIRYRTDDYATREFSTCDCNRNWDRFSNVQGRWNIESVVGRNGSRISAAALNMHGDLFKNVLRFQYYQKTIGKLEIRILPSPSFSNKDEHIIINEHNNKLNGELDINIKIVSNIPLTVNGKHRRIVSEVM
jgi:phenylacetate-CoA ligase